MSSPFNVDLQLRPLPSVSMYQAKWGILMYEAEDILELRSETEARRSC